ncbi:CvpA family protein [Sulfurimonas sp. HSL-1716]|uniref:CvpA family protein n=1 Tax=Hydrocurvibacter sulfurireducens TaxID=3131937 RepID=UPI0031F796DC
MEISYFDIIVGAIILLLGLKGIINGFFKELFGLIGIIGGVFVASRAGGSIGQMLSDSLLHIQNQTAINFTGFLVTLAVFWLVMVGVGFAFKKLSKLSGLGPVDKIMGFVVGAGKFFLIIAVIAYAVYNIKVIKTNMQDTMKSSILFPVLVETGGFIMKLDTTQVSKDINETVTKKQEEMQTQIEKTIAESKDKVLKDVSDQIQKNEENMTNEVKEKIKDAMPEDMKKRVN